MERAAIVSGQTLLVLVLGEWIGNNSLELYNVLVGQYFAEEVPSSQFATLFSSALSISFKLIHYIHYLSSFVFRFLSLFLSAYPSSSPVLICRSSLAEVNPVLN